MKTMVSVRIENDILKGLDALAKKQNRTRTNCIETIIIKAVKKEGGKKQ